MAELLLQNGANIEAKQYQEFTSRHVAAEQGHRHIVTSLLAKGANAHARSHDGQGALHAAARNGHHEVGLSRYGTSFK